ncbi:MAG TPA: hypothetical protein VK472_06650 [Allosphingosinicella sp.]|nr:hypothetical protein [Allosphingosinicella sp.]
MVRYLTALLILVVVIAHGSSVAAKVCLHQNAHEHALARQSRDRAVAAIPIAEDAAAAVDSKKGSQAPSSSFHSPMEMLPAALPIVPIRKSETIRLRPGDQLALASTRPPPPTRPPSA